MSNVLATSTIVATEALMVLKNMLPTARRVNRVYEEQFNREANRPGDNPGGTMNIKRPPRYTYRAGRVAVPQATVESTIPLTLQQGGTDIQFSSAERKLSATRFEDKVMAAMAPVCNEIDRQGLDLFRLSTFNVLNPTGVAPNTAALSIAAMTGMGQRLDEMAAPRDGMRNMILSPGANAALVQGFGGYFNSPSTIGKQNNTGMLQDTFGFDVAMGQNVSVHTNGAATATAISGANQVGSAITVVAIAGGTLTRGTSITLPGVFAVNPQSRTSTGQLANFVVTADALVGATTINISPAIVTSGALQNVTASPTTAAPYVILGAANANYNANIAFHRDAMTMAMVPLWQPDGLGPRVSVKSDDGFSVRVIEYYDGTNDFANMRIDVLFGWAMTYPELAVKYYTV